MHLPELLLLPSAMRRFRGLGGQRVDLVERIVHEDVADLSGRDVVLLDVWEREIDMPFTVRALEVRELDQDDIRAGVALLRRAGDVDASFDGANRRGRPQRLEQALDFGD